MKMSNNPTKYEVLIKQYLRSILDISGIERAFERCGCYVYRIDDHKTHSTVIVKTFRLVIPASLILNVLFITN